MKLLLCPYCSDVRKLRRELTTCECGKSSGRYLKNGLKAEVWGDEALIIGLDNTQLARVIDLHLDRIPKDNLSIAAWIMGEPAKNVKYHRIQLISDSLLKTST